MTKGPERSAATGRTRPAFLLALLGGIALSAGSAAAQETPLRPPPLPLTPESGPLDSLRAHFHGAVAEEVPLEVARSLHGRLAEEAAAGRAGNTPGDGASTLEEAVLLAYGGAIEVLRARDAWWPPSRLGHLETGRERLDRAVALAPTHPEVRYLRLATERHLPGLFRRDDVVREDALRVQRELAQGGVGSSEAMRAFIEAFVASLPPEVSAPR